MSQVHKSRETRMRELAEELIGLLREGGLPWRHVEGYLLGAVDHHRDKEEHPEDYDFGFEDEDTGVYQLAAPFCPIEEGGPA